MKDLVSVIIGTYERYELVQRAIESVLNQSYGNIELIVVDDCSQDERYKSLISSKDFKFVQMDKNSGLPACPRNVGIKSANGNWIAFLDDDDFFLKDKIKIQMDFSKKYDFICSDAYCDTDLKNKYLKDLYIDYWNNTNDKNTNELDYNIISKHNLIINSSVLVRKDLLFSVGLIDQDVCPGEDWKTWLKLLKNKTKYCKFIENPLLYYNMKTEKKYIRK
jgi:teichuronic acid biosynthesis glycosyltransferase TuaG